MFDTPILFLVFNRPDTTQRVFDQIKKIKPKKLYISADGPRDHNFEIDSMNLQMVKKIFEGVNWDCQVITNYRHKNLGCGKAVSEGISWFFNQEEMGIVLEDDCLPSVDFFNFCQKMLIKYKDQTQIKFIGGTNYIEDKCTDNSTYYFTSITYIWGWASWRRTWNEYKLNVNEYNLDKANSIFYDRFKNKSYLNSWRITQLTLKLNLVDTWDYQTSFLVWMNNGFNIMPSKNLISNIGFGENATHTIDKNSVFSNMKINPLPEINFRTTISHDLFYDTSYMEKYNVKINFLTFLYTTMKLYLKFAVKKFKHFLR